MKTLREKVLQDVKALRELDVIKQGRYERVVEYLGTGIGHEDMIRLEKDGCSVTDATELALFAVGQL